MHKHKSNARKRAVLKDQNQPLTESVTSLLLALAGKIEGTGFRETYLREEYLSKYADPSPDGKLKRVEAAIDKWTSQEDLNLATNERLRSIEWDYNILPRVTLRSFVAFTRRTISSILGPLDDFIVIGGFSGGASTSHRRTASHPAWKFSDEADATEQATKFVDLIYRQSPLLGKYSFCSRLNVVNGAVLFTVPKNALIERCACKEPDLNMYLQKGVGNHIARRLLRKGIDLWDQGVNRGLAKQGSLTGDLATLDLSSASDSVTIELVRLLLPHLWFEYLDDIRSQNVLVRGGYRRTEMFSSMGNGFTFGLESLLFYALARSVLYFEGIKGRLSVYGDDIIVPSSGAYMLVSVLRFFGFSTNQEKSFIEGPFRESCGGHYHNGMDVTPFYLKRRPSRLTDLIRVANQLRSWLLKDDRSGILGTYHDQFDLWAELRDLVPESLWGGVDLTLDTCLVTSDSPRMHLVRVKEKMTLPENGKYLHWHSTKRNRAELPDKVDREAAETVLKCRKRRAPQHWGSSVATRRYFLQEVPDITH
jgi:hypothetical protein